MTRPLADLVRDHSPPPDRTVLEQGKPLTGIVLTVESRQPEAGSDADAAWNVL